MPTAPPPRLNRHLSKLTAYPPGKPIEEVKREFGLDDVVKLASNENPLGPSPKAMKAMIAAAGEMHLYPDGAGYYLKQALATQLGVSPDELILGNGSDELNVFLALAYLNPRRALLTSPQAFIRYRDAALIAGAPVRYVPMDHYRHNLKAMAAAVDDTTGMICLDVPGNPTGTIVTRRELISFLKSIPPEVIVLLDQAYFEFAVGDPDYADGLQLRRHFSNLVVTRTFSKAYGLAGLRIGYGVARPEIIHDLERLRPPFNANRMAQAAAIAALADTAFLRKSTAANARGLKQLEAGLHRLKLDPVPSRANFILVDTGRDGRAIFTDLLRRGVVTRPMAAYGLPQHLRISVGAAAENRRCLAALQQVLALHPPSPGAAGIDK